MSERFYPSTPPLIRNSQQSGNSTGSACNNPVSQTQQIRPSPICSNSDNLFNSLERLDKAIEELSSRLHHILTPEPPSQVETCKNPHGPEIDLVESQVAAQFRSATDRVSAAASKLQALSFCVEL